MWYWGLQPSFKVFSDKLEQNIDPAGCQMPLGLQTEHPVGYGADICMKIDSDCNFRRYMLGFDKVIVTIHLHIFCLSGANSLIRRRALFHTLIKKIPLMEMHKVWWSIKPIPSDFNVPLSIEVLVSGQTQHVRQAGLSSKVRSMKVLRGTTKMPTAFEQDKGHVFSTPL